jgi:hypothetical protein
VWQFADLRFADPIFFAICRFCDLLTQIVADLQLLQICQFFTFLFTNNYLKCSNSNFLSNKKFCQTNLLLMFNSLSYGGKFADLQFADWLTNKICRFAICRSIKRNLQTLISQKIYGFAIAD